MHAKIQSRLIFSINQLSSIMYTHMLIMIRFCTRRFATNVARVRPNARMDFHMVFQVVAAMEGAIAARDGARELLRPAVLLLMAQTIVLSNELLAAYVAYKGLQVLMGVQVGRVVGLAEKRALTLIALEWHGVARLVRPLVQLHVPFGRKLF